ncbi:Paraxanthine methyltransferase [Thalictrum thalictroides]|uniref:Paraxanthine methyltransferase n=1 Tax=Thalictrum thalictroides TaxID=46969 RepID=A0A7J6UQU3_THATH|nr:Paraxanthine methyltransferase [Thalictrum thalictroides]
MEDERNIVQFLSMNGGDGPLSYANNSCYQKAAVDCTKAMVNEAIINEFDIKQLPSATPYRIADLGCSVGPNTFIAVQNIIEAVERKYQSNGLDSSIPEFLVFFNDRVSNDFNTLFSFLPSGRRYFGVGVPGSFHARLFPKASLHFVYSSYALHWLSKLPKEILDKNSPAWNKGRIHYVGAPNNVFEAYSTQFRKDMQSFLDARAEEVAPDGLMALLFAVVPNGTLPSESFIYLLYELLGFALMDMANMGLVSEDKVHSFNLPIYFASPQELEDLVEINGCFTIKSMIPIMTNQMKNNITILDYNLCILHIRVGVEHLIVEHFGSEIIDELFNRFSEKVAAESQFVFKQDYLDNFVEQFVLLRRKVT